MGNFTISVIIATYNAGEYLQRAIDSFKIQSYQNKELVIIDGNSKDNTLEVIKSNQQYINYWISEDDTGITDAWNKGIKACNGDWILFLGADDILLDNALDIISNHLNNKDKYELLIGDVELINKQGSVIKLAKSVWEPQKIKRKMCISHQGIIHSKSLFTNLGEYNINYKLAADYEFLLRNYRNIRVLELKRTITQMQMGGISDSQIYNVFKEWRSAQLKHNTMPRILVQIYYFYRVIRSKIKRKLLKGLRL